jgi:hypothetical protein
MISTFITWCGWYSVYGIYTQCCWAFFIPSKLKQGYSVFGPSASSMIHRILFQYSMTNKMYHLYPLYYELTASTCFAHYLLIIRKRCTNSNWYTACLLCQLAATRVGVEFHSNPGKSQQYTNCLCNASWRWASSARNRLLIRKKVNTKSASCWSYYTDTFWYIINKTLSLKMLFQVFLTVTSIIVMPVPGGIV